MPPLARIAAGLALGTLGGVLFHALALPLPWMLGALFFTMAASVAGLPPTFIAVGDVDGGAGQGLAFAERLINARVPVEVHVYPGAIHGFDLMAPQARVSRQFYEDLREALRRAFR